MLLFYSIKKYNRMFNNRKLNNNDITHHINDIIIQKNSQNNSIELYDDLPDAICIEGSETIHKWFKEQNVIHRENGPAIITYENDKIKSEEWYDNGNGPYRAKYYKNGILYYEQFYEGGKIHRKDGPAFIQYYENGSIAYNYFYENGKYRKDGPGIIGYYGNGSIAYEIWYDNDKYHRKGGPAKIDYYRNGQVKLEYWYENGEYRKDGPVIISYYEDGRIIYKSNV